MSHGEPGTHKTDFSTRFSVFKRSVRGLSQPTTRGCQTDSAGQLVPNSIASHVPLDCVRAAARLAALSRILPRQQWDSFFVAPRPLHWALVRRRWT